MDSLFKEWGEFVDLPIPCGKDDGSDGEGSSSSDEEDGCGGDGGPVKMMEKPAAAQMKRVVVF